MMLPGDFWKFAFATEQVSLASFFAGRLDYLLILSYGGLKTLGRYVAVYAIASAVPTVNGVFFETLLPSLPHLSAVGQHDAASHLFARTMRAMLLIDGLLICAIVVFASVLGEVLGPQYRGEGGAIALLAVLLGVSNPAAAGGSVLSSYGQPRRAVWSVATQVCVLALLFLLLWRPFGLLGAVIAAGSAALLGNMLLLWSSAKILSLQPIVIRTYAGVSATCIVALGASSILCPRRLGPMSAAYILAVALLFLLCRCSPEEFTDIFRLVSPFHRREVL
jgi:O-antigen/teichoic acid export membrane protein